MPARKLPTPQDAAAARRMLLDGLARDADILELVSELAPLRPRNNTFPGEVFLCLAADALEWCGASIHRQAGIGRHAGLAPSRACRLLGSFMATSSRG